MTLVKNAPMLQELSITDLWEDCDVVMAFRTLPTTLVKLAWIGMGERLAIAEQFAKCMNDPSWLPNLKAIPNVSLGFGTGESEENRKEKFRERILAGAKVRGLSLTEKAIRNVLNSKSWEW